MPNVDVWAGPFDWTMLYVNDSDFVALRLLGLVILDRHPHAPTYWYVPSNHRFAALQVLDG